MSNNFLQQAFIDVLTENVMDEYFYGDYEFEIDDINSEDAISLYHVTELDKYESILKYGFDSQFNGSNGNCYGRGVYTSFSIKDSRHQLGSYGDVMLQVKLLGGFDKFLIFDEDIARKYYGDNWQLIYQLKSFLSDDVADELWNRHHLHVSGYAYEASEYGIRGAIYHWGGTIAVLVYDFTALVPYAYSMDGGRTFKPNDLDAYTERMLHVRDMDYHFKGQYLTMESPQAGYDENGDIVGFAIVQKNNGKWNYLNVQSKQEMLPFDCDSLTPFNPDNGEFQMEYKGKTFMADFYSFYDAKLDDWFPLNEIEQHL